MYVCYSAKTETVEFRVESGSARIMKKGVNINENIQE